MTLLEICCADIRSVIAANAGGADRIELCTALEVDGLTPSAGLISEAIAISHIPVRVLIRPRPGSFVYDSAEIKVMKRDISICHDLGASGVVIGALTPSGAIETDACAALINAAAGMPVTFHRAFDVCASPTESLRQIIDLGCDTLLTSGQKPHAADATEMIATLVAESAGRLNIMAGSGINPANAAKIIRATGCACIHGSARGASGSTESDIVNRLHAIVNEI